MNSDKNQDNTLPNGWELCTSKSNPGRKYFFNRKTGKSSWTRPQDGNAPVDNRTRKKVKEKERCRTETKSTDPTKKYMKRKSDGGSSQDVCNKKKKEETPVPARLNNKRACPAVASTSSPIKTPIRSPTKRANSSRESTAEIPAKKLDSSSSSLKGSPVKRADTSRSSIKKSPTPTPRKNIANARMSLLRAELATDAKKEQKSPKLNSPTQAEAKHPKELKSPNDSKPTQSPDSLQSAPSPSQFFAANKIISSIKAQLPEEYTDKVKQKDTFADIEQGITNQTTDYPYMKHPATPPQFSEASKLVSAIKSKLSYKSSKETPVKSFKSAKDRLETLRTRLSSEVMDVNMENNDSSGNTIQYSNEAMEVDLKEAKQNVPVLSNVKDNVGSSKENIVLVVDTNIFIHELDFIKNVMNSHIAGYTEQPTLLVPWRVINELDRLKDNNNGNGAICKRARPAMDYLYKSLPENDRIKVQPLRDANSHIYPCESPDDEILNCCLQQAERGKSVILLSNDKNLCTKAVANGVQHKPLRELSLTPTPQPRAAPDAAMRVQKHIYTLLANILENEMRAKYDNLWLHVLFKPPPWTLSDVLQCLLKHWIAVFNELFPRIEHLINDLKNCLVRIERKDSKNITQIELANFKDLCLEIAKRCQIIPEYMELAKKTVARLQRDGASESDDECDKDGESVVIETFEGVWTVFSSYCAKLASGLGIAHTIEDKLQSDDSVDVLTSKLHVFGNQILSLSAAIEGVLTENLPEKTLEEHISQLERAFRDSLGTIGVDSGVVNSSQLRIFSTKCRNMLQEAHSKFTQLVDLLQVCKNNIENNR